MNDENIGIDPMHEDEHWMRLAIELAKRGEGKVSPNPLVGAVVVKEGRLLKISLNERYTGCRIRILRLQGKD